MRLAYLSAPILGLLLVGCGPDEADREQTPPKPAAEQPATPPATWVGSTSNGPGRRVTPQHNTFDAAGATSLVG